MRIMLFSLVILVLGGCSFVKLTPQGENVAVMQLKDVTRCENVGSTTVSVVSKVVVNRKPDKVALELRVLARNRAAASGDAIVSMTPVINGEQTFNIYRCRN